MKKNIIKKIGMLITASVMVCAITVGCSGGQGGTKVDKMIKRYVNEDEKVKIASSERVQYVTKMEDAEKQYSQAGREDLASECRDELEVLRKLLPEPVTASEIYEELRYWAEKNHYINDEIASEIQIPKKEMGMAIKFIKSKLPTADGKMISEIVKENLE